MQRPIGYFLEKKEWTDRSRLNKQQAMPFGFEELKLLLLSTIDEMFSDKNEDSSTVVYAFIRTYNVDFGVL